MNNEIKQKIQRGGVLLLAGVMCLSALTGCGSKKEKAGKTEKTATVQTADSKKDNKKDDKKIDKKDDKKDDKTQKKNGSDVAAQTKSTGMNEKAATLPGTSQGTKAESDKKNQTEQTKNSGAAKKKEKSKTAKTESAPTAKTDSSSKTAKAETAPTTQTSSSKKSGN